MFLERGAKKRRLGIAERCVNDVFDVLRPPFLVHYFELDMTGMLDVLERVRRESGWYVSFSAMLIKASAIALMEAPRFLEMLHGSRLIRPPTIDVSLSVAGRTRMAQLAVVKDAPGKSLIEIGQEVIKEVWRIHQGEVRKIALYNRLGWIVPGFLRWYLLRLYLRSYRGVRNSMATLQISDLSTFSMDVTISRVCLRPLLIPGAIKERPFVVDGKLEVRPTCVFALHVDQRVIDRVAGDRFVKALSGVVEKTPEAMFGDGTSKLR